MDLISSINSYQLENLLKTTEITLIDVRTIEEFNEEHLWNSLNYPIDQIFQLLANLKPDSIIITISNRGDERAKSAAKELTKFGIRNVFWLEKGIQGWIEDGMSDYISGTSSS